MCDLVSPGFFLLPAKDFCACMILPLPVKPFPPTSHLFTYKETEEEKEKEKSHSTTLPFMRFPCAAGNLHQGP